MKFVLSLIMCKKPVNNKIGDLHMEKILWRLIEIDYLPTNIEERLDHPHTDTGL